MLHFYVLILKVLLDKMFKNEIFSKIFIQPKSGRS